MLGTYASFTLCFGAAALAGQAIITACGRRELSPLAPAVGLAALCPLAWWTVRLPGENATAVIAIGLAVVLSGAFLLGRLDGSRRALNRAAPIAVAALALASVPFIVEGRFGILGTGLNPDMSQHLFAVDRLVAGTSERLISDGYPLGPHAIVAALSALGPSTVHAFDGLMLAVCVATALACLGTVEQLLPSRRLAAALLVGFAYLLASNFVQGAFKEAIEALFLLAFAVGLGELAAEWHRRRRPGPPPLRAIPLAVLAIGSVYAYSFPGLVWILAALGAWAAIELGRTVARRGAGVATAAVRAALPTTAIATGLFAVVAAPEVGRMVEFASFETFDPAGAGLGNLFNRLSPLEALGIWPSGDFRVEPGGGAVPAILFWLGAALAAAALVFGLRWWWRERERAVPAALGGAALLWLYSLAAGTPYQEAKALVLVAPLAMLISARALLESSPSIAEARRILGRRSIAHAFPGRARVAKQKLVVGALALAFCAAAAGSSLLALANGPVGPAGYSPALAELRPELPRGSVLVLAPPELLDDQHGTDYLAWELRGNRICIEPEPEPALAPRAGVAATVGVAIDGEGAVVPAAAFVNRHPPTGPGPCPLIPDSARADPSAGG